MNNNTETVEATIVESTTNTEQIQRPVINKSNNINNRSTSIIKLDTKGAIDLSKYSTEELEKFKSIAANLNVHDNNSILNYGVEVQNKLASHSGNFLDNIRQFDAGDIGSTITDMLGQINMIEIDPSEQSGVKRMLMKIPLVKTLVKNTKKIFQQYDTISNNVDAIVTKLDKGRLTIFKDNTALQNLFDSNMGLIGELEQLIIGGKIKLSELEAEVVEMEANPENYDPYEIADKREFITRLSKKLGDMMLTRHITIQSLPQIRLVQNNNSTMVEKIQSSITTTIPIWKGLIAIAVALTRQKNIADISDKIYDTTNEMLSKNANMLKMNSIQVAKQNERGVVDVAALRKVQEDLVSTLQEVQKIKVEGEAARKIAEVELDKLETQLKTTIGDSFSKLNKKENQILLNENK